MTLNDLFSSFFESEKIYSPVKRPPQTPSSQKSYKHCFYPLLKLDALIAELKKLSDDEDENKFSVRYLVTPDKKIIFAREGREGRDIPAHKSMNSTCLAAGNIFFSPDFKLITKINHQSGDFHPDMASLLWPLAILSLMKAPLANPFIIEVGGDPKSTILLEVDPADIAAFFASSEVEQEMMLQNSSQVIAINEHSVASSRHYRFNFNAAPKKPRSLAFNLEDSDLEDSVTLTPASAASSPNTNASSSALSSLSSSASNSPHSDSNSRMSAGSYSPPLRMFDIDEDSSFKPGEFFPDPGMEESIALKLAAC